VSDAERCRKASREGTSPRRSFLAPEITCLTGLVREGQKRETGSIESEVDLRGGSGGC